MPLDPPNRLAPSALKNILSSKGVGMSAHISEKMKCRNSIILKIRFASLSCQAV